MANRRFIDFPIASSVGDSDIILIWQSGANKQTTKATFLSGLPENLDELNDVAISGLTNGQILRYDSVTGKWENTDQGNLDLNDLNDVQIVSPSNGQVLVYNSSTSKWENSSAGFVPYTGAVTTVNLGSQTIQAGQFVKVGGTAAQFLKANGSVDSTTYGTGSVTSVALTVPSAFSVANSPITTAGTFAVTGAGTVGQYIRGDGSLADFPATTGGGSSVSYYLNGSVSQGTIGGVAYKQLNRTPVFGAGTDFTIAANGYIASFITDASDPNKLLIPAGNWNFETYFSASSNGGSPSFYVELYKYDGTTFTLIATSSSAPELIAFGTSLNPYYSTLAVPQTTLALTDRLAIRYYVTHSGRTITLHTEDNHLCQIITTFTTGLTALNGLTAQVQNFAVGTSGTDFAIASATATHTFNLPTASATNRGALSSADWTTFNNKTSNLGTVTSVGLSSATSGVTIGSSPVTTSGTITLAIATASGSLNGLLSSTDWTTFNNKASTAALAAYLPLAGGTLTGALNGTSATFSGVVTTNGSSSFSGYGLTTKGTYGLYVQRGSTNDSGVEVYHDGTNAIINSTYQSTGSFGGMLLYTGGSPRLTIASDGNVGIGTTSPINRLHIATVTNADISIRLSDQDDNEAFGIVPEPNSGNGKLFFMARSGYNTAFNSATDAKITMRTNGNVGIGTTSPLDATKFGLQITSPIDKAAYLRTNFPGFTGLDLIQGGDGTGYLLLNDNNDLRIYTNITERMKITLDGYVRLSASSGGIQFNGDTAAANALDDYEEGTHSPSATPAGGGSFTTVTQSGNYVKIGKLVHYSFIVTVNSVGTATGDVLITLPFVVNLTPIRPMGSGRENALYGNTLQIRTVSDGSATALIIGGGALLSSWQALGTITYRTTA